LLWDKLSHEEFMKEQLKVSLLIKASIDEVWKGLTDPDLVKQYFFGTMVDSDWKKGSPIFFRGEWEGKKYEDKGTILSIEPGRHVAYSYWSSMSGASDVPENYKVITYTLTPKNGGVELLLTQECEPETKEHSKKNWTMVLDGLKKLLEK
jgi:uncharacterized protein YndB with AHSA1/START domain